MKFYKTLLFSAISMSVVTSEQVTVSVTPTVYETVTVTEGDQNDTIQTSLTASSNADTFTSADTNTKKTTTLAPAETSTNIPNTAQTGKFTGDGTYYEVGGADGACGELHSDSELVVAIGHGLYDTEKDSSNVSSYCGKKINAYYGGKTVQVTIVDRCVGCSDTSLDFSPTAFQQLADESLGRISITWDWA